MIESVLIGHAGRGLHTELWSQERFSVAREEWNGLLASSDADPLFMSWDWQWRWWWHHAGALGATLRLLALYSDKALVGLAPFYSRNVTVRGVLRPCRLELIGTVWRDGRAAFSDYLDIISARAFEVAVRESVTAWLESEQFWDEIVLCCVERAGGASSLVQPLRAIAYVRELDQLSSWRLPLPPTFDQFIQRLPSDIRRKLFNHRAKLSSLDLQYAGEADAAAFLDDMWHHSALRWGHPARYAENGNTVSRSFHLDFASYMARAGQLRLSRLRVAGGTASVMYNVRVGSTVYYLQSAFDAARTRGTSPGYLHFGYAIEAACGEFAEQFDFLAGRGRQRDYKRELLTEPVPVTTYHIIRGRLARALYAAHEALTRHRDSSCR